MSNRRENLQHLPEKFTIAIDGSSAAGKSTVGELLADKLDAIAFDTGLLYRAVTLDALERQIDLDDEESVAALARDLELTVTPPSVDDGRRHDIWLDGQDITWRLRSTEVDRFLPVVSAYPQVRSALLEPQRKIGRSGRVIMIGRDIGTVILPDADLKIYLDASLEERARRRYHELAARDVPVSFEEVLRDLEHRDSMDSQRALAPLRPADDAVRIETDDLSVDDVVDRIFSAARDCIEAASRSNGARR